MKGFFPRVFQGGPNEPAAFVEGKVAVMQLLVLSDLDLETFSLKRFQGSIEASFHGVSTRASKQAYREPQGSKTIECPDSYVGIDHKNRSFSPLKKFSNFRFGRKGFFSRPLRSHAQFQALPKLLPVARSWESRIDGPLFSPNWCVLWLFCCVAQALKEATPASRSDCRGQSGQQAVSQPPANWPAA